MKNHAKKQHFLFRAMKIGGFQLLIIILTLNCLYAGSLISQDKLDQKISLSVGPTELINVLDEIESITDLVFTYSIQKIDIYQQSQLEVENQLLSNVIKHFFKTLDINYKIYNGRNIVLSRPVKKKRQEGITLIGELTSEENEPIQFANIVLTNKEDVSLVIGNISDEFGKFEIENIPRGEYNLNISFLGLESIDSTILIEKSIDLGQLTLSEKINLIDGVAVSSRRKLIKQKIDRIILDVENSILSSRGDAMEVLKSTPGISVINDRISMIGKSAVGIMINEKLLRLPEEDLANYLRSISSEDILEIEIISTPPAKYEAQGNSGLINIVLKKVKRNSWNAQIRAAYLQREFGSQNAGINFNYNKNKLSLAASVFVMDGSFYQEQDDYAYFPDGLWYTLSPFRFDYKIFNTRFDINYEISKRWEIGGQMVRNYGDNLVTDNPITEVYDNETNEIIRYLESSESTITQEPVFDAYNINNKILLDTSGRNLLVNFDYFTFENPDSRNYKGVSIINNPSVTKYYAGTNTNMQRVENMSGTLDLELPNSWINLELGGKVAHSVSSNDISLFNSGIVETEVTDLPLSANDFKYEEDLQALYISGTKKLSNKLSTQVGFRVEATQTLSTSVNKNLNEVNDYIKLFPTAYLAYQADDDNSYSFSFSRRISRPNFLQLNPNVFYINPFQTILGNPFLQPSFTDNLELGHNNGNLSGKVYYSFEKDIFAQIPLADPTSNLVTFANENYVDTRRIGLSEYFSFNGSNWWSSSNSLDINYSISKFDLAEDEPNLTGFNSRVSTSNDFSIPGNDHWSFNLSYWYSFPGNLYIFNTLSASDLSASIQYKALNNQLKISLHASDIFKTQLDRTETTINGTFQTARYYYDNRRVYLAVSYSFGNREVKAKRHQTGNRDEAQRTGN